ncbi:MAG: family 20 glycosylhydrolase [Bacteroidales bacterium]|nr:family 20 glycosylhydrolase [Bacteroidales bacterium]
MNKNLLFIALIFIAVCSTKCNIQDETISNQEISIIPAPETIILKEGLFIINSDTRVLINKKDTELTDIAKLFVQQIKLSSNIDIPIIAKGEFSGEDNCISLELKQDEQLNDEAYELSVTNKKITIIASKPAGLFYGIQSLLQLLPAEIYAKDKLNSSALKLPAVEIKDKPRFSYRGMHLDVSRHFFPKEFIKKYIDLIAFNKMNTFHWHLVDDQGWRIEIKKYPKLTEVGGWRVDREDKTWGNRPAALPGEKATYGGYYTQEDIKEIVAYAKKKYVTIVPEIEMPAHVMSAIAAYPNLACVGDSITVPPGSVWPITKIYCAGNDSTFVFLENVLTEVIDLFPGQYIHIGGDEATKTAWKSCSKCQAQIKKEKLKNVEELQSYFIKRIEKFLVAKGKKMIGWDEILEGGLAPEATVMSWRGVSGGIAAAKSGHFAIMTPGSHCYFDHYQGDPDFEPEAFGGYTSLKKVYAYEPIPDELNHEEAKYILGAQANLWTEFVYDGKHAEYMVTPRISALAEVVWSPKEKRDWDNFNSRLQTQLQRYKYLDVNYCKGTTKLDIRPEFKDSSLYISVNTERFKPEIRYTLDGSEPNANSPEYKEPFTVSGLSTIKAALFEEGKVLGKVSERIIGMHKGLGKTVRYSVPFSNKYTANGESALVDGLTGSKSFNDGFWQGFEGTDMEVTIDLAAKTEIKELSIGFIQEQKSWLFLPKSVTFSISDDNVNFNLLAQIENNIPTDSTGIIIKRFEYQQNTHTCRYLKVKANALKVCPDWHGGAGQNSWIFVDEIIIN